MLKNVEFVSAAVLQNDIYSDYGCIRGLFTGNEELPFFIISYSDPLAGVQREKKTKIRGTENRLE